MMVRGPSEREPASRGVGGATRVLAIDYGRKRIGLALSDELRLTARPLAVLSRTNRRTDLRRLRDLCRKNDVSRVIIGHPLDMGGSPGDMANEAARFAARLEKELGVATELVDERLTTWAAEQSLADMKSTRRKREPLDDLAAAILLREYLEKNRSRGRATAQKA